MAEEQNQEQQSVADPQTPKQAQFQLQKIYVKDLSFEVPNAPQIFQDTGQAEIKLNLSQRVNSMADEMYEVVLTVTVTAMAGEKTAYLAEVHQSGLFAISGVEEQQKQAVLNTLCPHTLFPHATRVITDMVADGGFPPLVLQPVNFEQIYLQRLNQGQGEQSGDAGDLGIQGNA